jgi:hypothetical protein
MNDEWNKGYFSTGPQRSDDARQGQFARQLEQQRERGAASQAARERDQRFQDQMIREAIWSASRPAGTDADRIFGGRSRRGTSAAGWGLAVVSLALLYTFFGAADEARTMLAGLLPTQREPLPAAAVVAAPRPVEPPSARDALNSPGAAPADGAATAPAPTVDRFALRKVELVRGDDLDLLIAWRSPDGVRRAATMDAFIVTRDAARQRIRLLERWSVFPGEATIPLALPAGIAPGKYELETVWTLGGGALERRAQFTLVERVAASTVGSSPPLPKSPAPTYAEAAPLPTAAPRVIEPDPAPHAAPAPPAETSVAADRPPPTTLASPPARPRPPANEPLYTGG